MEKNIKQMKLKLINNNKINNNFYINKKFIDAPTNYNFFNLPHNHLNSKLNFYYVNKNIIYPVNNKNYKLNYKEYYNYHNNNNNNNNNNDFHKISKSNEIKKKFKIKINDSNFDDINNKYTNINSPNHIKRKFRFLSIDYINKIFCNNSNKNKFDFKNIDINSKNKNYKNSKKKKFLSRNNINEIFSNSNENNYSNKNSLTTSNVKIRKINPLKYKTFHLDSQKNVENFKLLKLLINNQRRKNFELIEGIKEEILKNEFLLKTYNVTLFNKNLHILNEYKTNKKYDK